MFIRKLTGALAVTAVAFSMMTAAAAPARADEEMIRKLGGVAAIALGAKIIHDNREERREADRRRDNWDRNWDRGEHRGHRNRDRDDDRDRRHREARLPDRCITDYDRRRGQVVAMYDENCLRRHAR